ncbi:MAG: class I SAM-dependent methyltransferase, partial [Candidatus Heimdallarchaeota archaeon]
MVNIDPEGIELKTVQKYASFRDKRILEIGCGDGRLTFKYAAQAKHVIAIDPVNEEIEKAKQKIPKELSSTLEFRVNNGENLPFRDQSLDIVFFTYSLCCFSDLKNMKEGLEEAWRVLVPEGVLINLQPSLHQPFIHNQGNIAYLITRRPKALVDPDGEEWIDRTYNARSAIKEATLIDQKFSFITEEAVALNEYYQTIEEFLADKKEIMGGDLVDKQNLPAEEIHQMAEIMRTPNG